MAALLYYSHIILWEVDYMLNLVNSNLQYDPIQLRRVHVCNCMIVLALFPGLSQLFDQCCPPPVFYAGILLMDCCRGILPVQETGYSSGSERDTCAKDQPCCLV